MSQADLDVSCLKLQQAIEREASSLVPQVPEFFQYIFFLPELCVLVAWLRCERPEQNYMVDTGG
jgi:hypothetical protein